MDSFLLRFHAQLRQVTAGGFDPVTEVVTPCPGHARWLLDFRV